MNFEEQDFEKEVDSWVFNAVQEEVPDFNSLLKFLPGVYPTLVVDSLNRLSASGLITNQVLIKYKSNNNSDNKLQLIRGKSQDYIIPHPLDYDWRFTNSSISYLLEKFLKLSEVNETISFIGAPSLFINAQYKAFREIVLLEKNSAVVNHIRRLSHEPKIFHCDVTKDSPPAIESSVVFLDPPWYQDHLIAFLWMAVQICKIGGSILISLPPKGTRPGIEIELNKFFNWASEAGLSQQVVEVGRLSYISPPFEINSLRAKGLIDFPIDWRRGDLVVFNKIKHNNVLRPVIVPHFEDNWLEETIYGVRIQFRPYHSRKFQNPKLLSLVESDILPSVSRRDPRRNLIDVWTSGNRVYTCNGLFIFHKILQSIKFGKSPVQHVQEELKRDLTKTEKIAVNTAGNQLKKIIKIELKEITEYLDTINQC